MIETASGNVPWTKLWHARLLANTAFCALDCEAVGAYLWLRLLAGQTNNNGSISFGAAKRMTADQVREFLRDVVRVPPRRAAGVLERLQKAGLMKVSRAGVVTLSGWMEDQAQGGDVAMRQRISRARHLLVAFLSEIVEPVHVSFWTERISRDSEWVRLVSLKSTKASLLTHAQRVMAQSPGSSGSPPQGSGQGCDMSHRRNVTCHTRPETETETEEEMNISPDTLSPEPVGSGGAQGALRTGPEEPAGTGGRRFAQGGGDPEEPGDWKTVTEKYPPVPLAMRLCRKGGKGERDIWTARIAQLERVFPGGGEAVFYNACYVVFKKGDAAREPDRLLNKVINRMLETGDGTP